MKNRPVITTGPSSISVTSAVRIVPDDREVAWRGPVQVFNAPDRAFMIGRYVHGGLPANRNGHLFPVDELVSAHKMVPYTPLNIMHQPRLVVGANIATEYGPDEAGEFDSVVESLSVFWRWNFSDEWHAVERAFEEGKLWYSMEAVPKTVECAVTGQRFPFDGPFSPAYSKEMQERQGTWLHDFLFVGGALVLPPGRPGWAEADITEFNVKADRHSEESQVVLEQITESAPHLSPKEAEELTVQLVAHSHRFEPSVRRELVAAGFDPGRAPAAMDVLLLGGSVSDALVELQPPLVDREFHYAGIVVDPVDAHAVAGVDVAGAHVTVVLSDANYPASIFEGVLREWAADTAPFKMTVGGSTTIFENGSERPFVADVESPELFEAQAKLVAMLRDAGLEPGGRGADEYHPHMTIRYLIKDEAAPPIQGPVDMVAAEIELNTSQGSWRIPLTGPPAIMELDESSEEADTSG